MLFVKLVQMHFLLLIYLVFLLLVRDDVGYGTADVSKEKNTHDHEYAADYSLPSIGSTDVAVANSRHSSYCKVK